MDLLSCVVVEKCQWNYIGKTQNCSDLVGSMHSVNKKSKTCLQINLKEMQLFAKYLHLYLLRIMPDQ